MHIDKMQNTKMHKMEMHKFIKNIIPVSERGEREFIKIPPLLCILPDMLNYTQTTKNTLTPVQRGENES